jgi:hypothetical protein
MNAPVVSCPPPPPPPGPRLWENVQNLYRWWPCSRGLGGGLDFVIPEGWEPVGGSRRALGTYRLRQGPAAPALPYMAILRRREPPPQQQRQRGRARGAPAPAWYRIAQMLGLSAWLDGSDAADGGGLNAPGGAADDGDAAAAGANVMAAGGGEAAGTRGHMAIILRGTNSAFEWEKGGRAWPPGAGVGAGSYPLAWCAARVLGSHPDVCFPSAPWRNFC